MVPRALILLLLLVLPRSAPAEPTTGGVQEPFIKGGVHKPVTRGEPLSATARAILAGAREEVRNRTRYDLTMGYHVTRFKDGKPTPRSVYPGGDVDPDLGVCTDLVVRALRRAGHDLQRLIAEDRRKNPRGYVGGKANHNIDQRRVPNQMLFFRRHGQRLTTRTTKQSHGEWLGGDIVFWNLDGRGRIDHVGIVSDRRDPATGRPWVIHAYPMPGFTAEVDVLESWPIAGHFRYPTYGRRVTR